MALKDGAPGWSAMIQPVVSGLPKDCLIGLLVVDGDQARTTSTRLVLCSAGLSTGPSTWLPSESLRPSQNCHSPKASR